MADTPSPLAIERVDDLEDPRLDALRGLTDAEARRHHEALHGVFVIEGQFALEVALASRFPVRRILCATDQVDRVAELLRGAATPSGDPIPVHVAEPAVLETITGFRMHRGIIASGERLPLPDPAGLLAEAAAMGRDVVVLEGVNDHENLGALFRNAAAFGLGAVFLDPTTADPLYRRSVRVSVGHVLRVPFTRLPDLPGGLSIFDDAGMPTAALTPRGSVDVHALAGPGPRAWLLGAEGPGLRQATIDAAAERVRIPIADGVDSLNVATAGAVAFAVGARARSAEPSGTGPS